MELQVTTEMPRRIYIESQPRVKIQILTVWYLIFLGGGQENQTQGCVHATKVISLPF